MQNSLALFSQKVAIVLMAVASFSIAYATSIEPTGFIGSFCASGGDYDAGTNDLSLTWADGGCGVRIGPYNEFLIGLLDVDESYITVNALVDNDGNALGGEFAWFGAIPGLGITNVSPLASGEVAEIGTLLYPDSGLVEAILVQIDFTAFAPELIDFGLSNLGLGPFGLLSLASLNPEGWPDGVSPWSATTTLISPTLNELFTYQTRPRLTVPEPGTFALLGIGLVGMRLARRKQTI